MDDDSDQDDSVELHVRPRRKNANLRPADILHQQKSTRRTRSQMVADEEAEKSAQASRQTELEGKRLKIAQVEAQLKSGKVCFSLRFRSSFVLVILNRAAEFRKRLPDAKLLGNTNTKKPMYHRRVHF